MPVLHQQGRSGSGEPGVRHITKPPTVVPGRLERLPTTYRFPGQETDADRRLMVDRAQDVGILVVAEFVA